MQIIIPMSGTGQRFKDAGYTMLKPLIEVDGKPMIAHIVSMFPNETDFTFICSEDALNNSYYNISEKLKQICPTGKILSVKPSKKGPVHAVLQVCNYISENDEVIINYCDFGWYWNYEKFLEHTRKRDADGAIPAYRHFHPHMLGLKNYAFIRDDKQWMLEIQEKKPFTNNRMNEFASSGTYYFKKGSYIKKYFNLLVEKDISVNGEYYVSMVYNLLKEDGLKVSVYEIEHMLQWGTPEDLEEYQEVSSYFADKCDQTVSRAINGTANVMLMAGVGSRFSVAGYKIPKPLLPISGKPMAVQAMNSYPKTNKNIFIMLKSYNEEYKISEHLAGFEGLKIIELEHVTQGQASTANICVKELDDDTPVLIASCDCEVLIEENKYRYAYENCDIIVFSFKNPMARTNPNSYGYLKVDENNFVQGVSVKKPISEEPYKDLAIVGSFFFKKAVLYKKLYDMLVKDNIRINNEFYIDSIIGLAVMAGMKVYAMEVKCAGWGNPDEYNKYLYWQSFFDKCPWHPYRLEKDTAVDADKIDILRDSFNSFSQHWT
jgi:NDP-sugar pyrophosphorylase family protein